METITSGQVIGTEFSDEVTSFTHFGIYAAKHVPVNCMECVICCK
jgi:hypothetical protein